MVQRCEFLDKSKKTGKTFVRKMGRRWSLCIDMVEKKSNYCVNNIERKKSFCDGCLERRSSLDSDLFKSTGTICNRGI